MKRRLFLIPIVVLLFFAGSAHAGRFEIDRSASEVRFTSKAPFETVIGKTGDVSGEINLSGENLRSVSGTITVKAVTIKTGNRLRDKNMREDYLETDRYPEIVFRIERMVSGPASLSKGEESTYTLEGIFEIHGVKKKIIVPATVSSGTDGGMEVKSEFVIGLSDFQIKRPSFLIMRLAEEVKVSVKLTLVPSVIPATRHSR